MQKKREGERVYTVVDVMAGVAVGTQSFWHLEDARACLRRLRRGRDLERDDVQLFRGTIHWYPSAGRVPVDSSRKPRPSKSSGSNAV